MSAHASVAPRIAADPQRLALAQSVLGKAEAKTQRERGPVRGEELERSGHSFPVPRALEELISRGEVRAGSSIEVTGPCGTSLALAIAAAAMGEESWCALVGMPHVGIAACADIGVDPRRTALIPDPGTQLSSVLSALIDGIEVIVLGADLALTPAQWRTAKNRARTQGSLLIRLGEARCDLAVQSSSPRWVGLARGSGRLRFRSARVAACGRGAAGSGSAMEIRIPPPAGVLASAPRTAVPTSRRGKAPARARATLTLVQSGNR